jgi:acetyl esterase/lipase
MMNASDLLALPRPVPDARIPYGADPNQFGELRRPRGPGPHPVVVVIHGGCWLAEYDLGHVSALARALTEAGFVTWSIEYRRIGHDGGGWPGTFLDVGSAADHLRRMAREHDLDLDRVVAVGHSAGGHLALWLSCRRRLSADDPLRGEKPLRVGGVLTLAGITDLAAFATPDGCGSSVPGLLGGLPQSVPARLRRVSPIELLPLGVPQILVTGRDDVIVPGSQAREYVEAGGRAGDTVELVEIPGAGHFELVDPGHDSFGLIRMAVSRLSEPEQNRLQPERV